MLADSSKREKRKQPIQLQSRAQNHIYAEFDAKEKLILYGFITQRMFVMNLLPGKSHRSPFDAALPLLESHASLMLSWKRHAVSQ